MQPLVRVAVVQAARSIEFTLSSEANVTDETGSKLGVLPRNSQWMVSPSNSVPGKTLYFLVAASMSTEEKARESARNLSLQGFEIFVEPFQKKTADPSGSVFETVHRVYLKKAFDTAEEARAFRDSIKPKLETFLSPRVLQAPGGLVRMVDSKSRQEIVSVHPLRIEGADVIVTDVPVGTGFHWERKEIRTYPGDMEFALDNGGLLRAVNILPLEEYLKGVLPSEMPEGFPIEALKTQAIAARSEALFKKGIVHASEGFDFCADVHCQVYSGLTRRAPSTDRAVESTAGLVLMHGGGICDAVYSSVCGGHTEDCHRVWGGEPKSYLHGVPDSRGRGTPLSNERNAERWIRSEPESNCRVRERYILPSLAYTEKYFRWKVRLSQEDLCRTLRERAGWDGGAVIDLVPMERGVSGRILRLKIKGQTNESFLEGELLIRRSLSQTVLWSSCFLASPEDSMDGIPAAFVLEGAGWGHGVGMCQTGAAVMALKGKHYQEILRHYYQGSRIQKLY